MKMLRIASLAAIAVCSFSALASPSLKVIPMKALGTTGQQFCQQYFAGDLTCIPAFDNTSTDVLNVAAKGYGGMDMQPNSGLALAGQQGGLSSATFKVTNKTTGATIYDGDADNMVGVTCSATACHAWK